MKTIYISLLLFLSINISYAQDELAVLDSVMLGSCDVIWYPPFYERWSTELKQDYFFAANDLDAAYLLRGDVPGMLITRPSGNPLDLYTFKTNGMSSFDGTQTPLFLVDGFPVLSLEGIDPMDIKSIKVDKDLGLGEL